MNNADAADLLTFQEQVWRRLHIAVNHLAWRFASPIQHKEGLFYRPLWRLNGWLGNRWIIPWSERRP